MAHSGPIILVEDELNDAEVIATAIKDIGIPNEIKVMHTAEEAHQYLLTTTDKPYVILCDIRMPKIDGLAFRKTIKQDPYLDRKSIPFIFLTEMVSQEIVNSAYFLDVQGFFVKAKSYEGIKEQMLAIFIYWKLCKHPNSGDFNI